MIQQIPLFSSEPHHATNRGPVDAASEALLSEFAAARLKSGAHRRTVTRDVSQLRALLRASITISGADTLAALFADLPQVAHVLCTLSTPISRSTGRARLLAAQQFVRFMCMTRGECVTTALATLDSLLPRQLSSRWHATGTLVAGSVSRSRRQMPTLAATDLARLVEAAGEKKVPWRAARDRALVALYCYTGLRAEEIARLEWDQVIHAVVSSGEMGLAVQVRRNTSDLVLLIAKPAASELEKLATSIGSLSGPMFHTHDPSSRRLSYRAQRDILRVACQASELPLATSFDLRAAFAYWLHQQGYSDHEITTILGLARVRSVDRMLARHKAINAQRIVRDRLDR